MCVYRHITRHQFANEVLNTLRNEFEIVLGQFGTDIPGSQQMQGNRNNQFGTDIPGSQQMQGNRNNTLQNNLQVRDSMTAQEPMMGNVNVRDNSEERMRRLERENEEIFCALDPNQMANSLEEIRARLLTLQSALEKPDNSNNTGMNRGQNIQSFNNVLTPFFSNNSNFNEPNIDSMRRGDVMARQQQQQQQQQVRIFFVSSCKMINTLENSLHTVDSLYCIWSHSD